MALVAVSLFVLPVAAIVEVGSMAPEFSATTHENIQVSLSDYTRVGRGLVLAFYPRAETTG